MARTQIQSDDVGNDQITTTQLANAAVTPSKADLTSAWNFSQLSGTLAGTLNANNQSVTNVPTPINPNDATPRVWVQNAISAASTPNATNSTPGRVQLTGDLAGTATSPTVVGVHDSANTALPIGSITEGSAVWRSSNTLSSAPFIGSLETNASPLGLGLTGVLVSLGFGTSTMRQIVAGSGVAVLNGDMVAGNCVISATGTFNAANTRILYGQATDSSIVWAGDTGFITTGGSFVLTSAPTNTYNSVQVAVTGAGSAWSSRPLNLDYRIGHNGTFTGRFVAATTLTNHRVWLAYTAGIGSNATPSAASCGLVYDPGRGTNWYVFSYDGTTLTATPTATAYTANAVYVWSVRTTASGVFGKVWVAGTTEPSETTVAVNLPGASTSLYGGSVTFVQTAAGTLTLKYISQQLQATLPSA